MTQIITILGNALQAVPMTIVPFFVALAAIIYTSYKSYIEFKAVYKKINAEIATANLRISKVEADIAKTDERTAILQDKLGRIEGSLERMNNTLIELSTTLRIMRENKDDR